MPELKDNRKTKIIKLPSYPGGEVEVYTSLLFGDLVDTEQVEGEIEKGLLIATRIIKSWNLTDEKGEILPITLENLKKLPSKDGLLIVEAVNEALYNPKEKKTG